MRNKGNKKLIVFVITYVSKSTSSPLGDTALPWSIRIAWPPEHILFQNSPKPPNIREDPVASHSSGNETSSKIPLLVMYYLSLFVNVI